MPRKKQTRGQCAYCGKEMTKGGLSRHLKTCPERQKAVAAANKKRGRNQTIYHLQVQDAWGGDYWLHLEMRGDATLEDLDDYLRTIWLECCGHLSAFEIGPVTYTQLFDDGMGWREERSMDVRVDKLFTPGMSIPYEYDFGTTSELVIKVVAERKGKLTTSHPIALMARNSFTPPTCSECDRPAAWICAECMWDEDTDYLFCDEHADKHEHEDMLMDIVNSPRTGMCAYSGPAEPPY